MPLGSASYYIKAFYEQGFVEGETMDSMALSQSPGINMQINNPVSSPDQQLSYTIKTANKVKFIKVLARFNFYDEKEFYLKPTKLNLNSNKNSYYMRSNSIEEVDMKNQSQKMK